MNQDITFNEFVHDKIHWSFYDNVKNKGLNYY